VVRSIWEDHGEITLIQENLGNFNQIGVRRIELQIIRTHFWGTIFSENVFCDQGFSKDIFPQKMAFWGIFLRIFFLRIAVLRKNMFSCCARESFLLYLHGQSCSPPKMGWHHGRYTQPQLISIIIPCIYTNYYANVWPYIMESTCVVDMNPISLEVLHGYGDCRTKKPNNM
jgi:hypothetical protein